MDWGQGVRLPTTDSVVTVGLGRWQGWLLHQARVVHCQGHSAFRGPQKRFHSSKHQDKIVGQEMTSIRNVTISIFMPMQS